MKILYFECNMGTAGDMLMASLYELLRDKEGFLQTMNSLGLPGVRVEAVQAATCGVAGTRIHVTVHGGEEGHHHDHHHGHDETQKHHHHHHATPGHIAELIDGLPLPAWVRQHARAVYDAIATAEAKAHGCDVGDVHFHEVGALDAAADVVGVCYAIYLLDPDKIVASPVHVGSGQVSCAHGLMPVPAPATAALLEGVPCYGGAIQGELCTPTGAALLKHFAVSFGPMPILAVEKTGYGLGSKAFEAANCVRAFLGEFMGQTPRPKPDDEIVELCCNLDDMTAEAAAFAAERLLSAGALDVSFIPTWMKKGRPGLLLTALCAVDREGEMAELILAETTTNGVRVRRCDKYVLTPSVRTVDTVYGPMRIKCAEGHGVSRAKPEYDDVARVARERGLPFRTVWDAVTEKI